MPAVHTATAPTHPGAMTPAVCRTPSTRPFAKGAGTFPNYMSRVHNEPVASHEVVLQLSRDLYRAHLDQLECLSGVPGVIGVLCDLHEESHAAYRTWTRYAIAVGDLSVEAKDRVLAEASRLKTGTVVEDTSVSSDKDLVAAHLDALADTYTRFKALPPARRMQRTAERDAISRLFLSIELCPPFLDELNAEFLRITDTLVAAKRAVVAAALDLPVEDAKVDEVIPRVAICGVNLALDLSTVLDPAACKDAMKERTAAPLSRLKWLEGQHSLSCERACELRRRFDDAKAIKIERAQCIVLGNLLFAVHTAFSRKFRLDDPQLNDAIQSANEGLSIAAYRFKYWLGLRFTTYSAHWVRYRGEDVRRGGNGVIDMLKSDKRRLQVIQDSLQRLGDGTQAGRPTVYAISQDTNLSVSEIDRIFMYDLPIHRVDDEDLDVLVSPDPALDKEVADVQVRQTLDTALAGLLPKQREVLCLRYGLNHDRPHSLAEIARLSGTAPETVYRIHRSALEALRLSEHSEVLAGLLG